MRLLHKVETVLTNVHVGHLRQVTYLNQSKQYVTTRNVCTDAEHHYRVVSTSVVGTTGYQTVSYYVDDSSMSTLS